MHVNACIVRYIFEVEKFCLSILPEGQKLVNFSELVKFFPHLSQNRLLTNSHIRFISLFLSP